MTRLLCIKEEADGTPVRMRLMRRRMSNQYAINDETDRLLATGEWTRVVQLCAWIPLHLQYAEWAASLIRVNPRFVLDPGSLVAYVRGNNWNDPDPTYAHYEGTVRQYGTELWHEFSSYRGVSVEEAVRRYTWLMSRAGLKPDSCTETEAK